MKLIISLLNRSKTFQQYLDNTYELGYSKGYGSGVVAERSKVLQRLEHHDVAPFKDESLKLGYDHAIEAVKDSLAKH